MKVGVFYGSTTGNTESVAGLITTAFVAAGHDVKCESIAMASSEELSGFDLLVLGTSTWGCGELQDDWEAFLPELKKAELARKNVALFGLGDQGGWSDTFVDAMGILYEEIVARGATVVGSWPTEGYDFTESRAVVDGNFVGLALDESSQAGETRSRITLWVGGLV